MHCYYYSLLIAYSCINGSRPSAKHNVSSTHVRHAFEACIQLPLYEDHFEYCAIFKFDLNLMGQKPLQNNYIILLCRVLSAKKRYDADGQYFEAPLRVPTFVANDLLNGLS